MFILVVDGQSGGIGRSLIEKLKAALPADTDITIGAAGTNYGATANMVKGGASFGATGDNAIVFNAAKADIILGPVGIVMANAIHGEISPAVATAITSSNAKLILVATNKWRALLAGLPEKKISEYVADAVQLTLNALKEKKL